MDYVFIPLIACGASLLTFFSGFGLGTLLTPVFVIFFPVEIAIALTAIVHFLNGVFKLILVGSNASKAVIIRFGIPAMIAAFFGAWTLTNISHVPAIASYRLFAHDFHIMPVKMVIAMLMIGFTVFELLPRLKAMEVSSRYLSVGGLVSGFFGGLSGHQGALRSAFLARTGLTKEQFVATGTVIAAMIDITRLGVYAKTIASARVAEHLPLLAATTAAAFVGAYLGSRLLTKITMHGIQTVVSLCLILLALALGAGLI